MFFATSIFANCGRFQVAVNRRTLRSVHHMPSALPQFALVYSVIDDLLQRLQCVQNAAARLVPGTRRCNSHRFTPVLQQLHRLHCCTVKAAFRVQADTVGVQGDPRSATTIPR